MHQTSVSVQAVYTYPFKSLPGIELQSVAAGTSGNCLYDRMLKFEFPDGTKCNGKWAAKTNTHQFFQIQTRYESFDWEVPPAQSSTSQIVTLSLDGTSKSAKITDTDRLGKIMSEFLDTEVTTQLDTLSGFPDDEKCPGATVISQKTIECIAAHFNLSIQEVIRRFRPNIIIDGVERLGEYALLGQTLNLGLISLNLFQPCVRCPVVAVNPDNGVEDEDFLKKLGEFVGPILQSLRPDTYTAPIRKHGKYLAVNTFSKRYSMGAKFSVGHGYEISE